MAPQDRVSQVSAHLNYPQGMLAGQVAIITGAGQGIGAEAARMFANEGAKVVVADIDAGWFYLLLCPACIYDTLRVISRNWLYTDRRVEQQPTPTAS